ncbi:DUF6250 domain-containing protein [Gramella sp. AN32]|uniref:DUF6250 domain-containing protein n=1 Tax=Christiangramia antarctica TaxID=2058158 RepID=A0ABW5X1I5_9FLAO|nr:DUF6250 domain-containing protein [Gramella sp. AN32]MCM4156945.1 hypothetical protein [Gramella sp. AN32]
MKFFQCKKMGRLFLLALTVLGLNSCNNKGKSVDIKGESFSANLIYQEDFDSGLADWKVEQMPGGTVEVNNGKLEINDVSGCTVWLKEKFDGPLMIEYDAFLIKEGGPNDRVSDLNCFWMATDPENPDDFFANSAKRGGKFSNYDSLQLYYMGVGGNDNSTTRFRRYTGDGKRPLLPEHDLSAKEFMLEPNTKYHIKIIANDEVVQYYRNDQLLVEYIDDAPYTLGYFGFRTVNNHTTVDNFKVYSLSK